MEALKYFEKAAQEGYSQAQSMLSKIYLGKASRYIYKAYNYYDENYNNDKMMMGNCLIADYLIGTRVTHYNHHDQYFDGLTKLTEASHEGCDDATFILNVLNKEKYNTVSKAIKTLSEREKLILKLYYGKDKKTQKEIAKILNTSQANVSRLVIKIVKKLKEIIKEKYE